MRSNPLIHLKQIPILTPFDLCLKSEESQSKVKAKMSKQVKVDKSRKQNLCRKLKSSGFNFGLINGFISTIPSSFYQVLWFILLYSGYIHEFNSKKNRLSILILTFLAGVFLLICFNNLNK